jgi:hypothetical protein
MPRQRPSAGGRAIRAAFAGERDQIRRTEIGVGGCWEAASALRSGGDFSARMYGSPIGTRPTANDARAKRRRLEQNWAFIRPIRPRRSCGARRPIFWRRRRGDCRLPVNGH